MSHVVESFCFLRQPFKPKIVPPKKELQAFYKALTKPRDRALFLIYAASGLGSSEVLRLIRSEVNFNLRALIPDQNSMNVSKHTWISFYNEAEKQLRKYLTSPFESERLLPISKRACW